MADARFAGFGIGHADAPIFRHPCRGRPGGDVVAIELWCRAALPAVAATPDWQCSPHEIAGLCRHAVGRWLLASVDKNTHRHGRWR